MTGSESTLKSVTITNPYTWPWVRRGSERLLNDLAQYLVGEGLDVEIYAMGPQDQDRRERGIVTHLIRQRLKLPFRQLNDCHYFAWTLQKRLARCWSDVVHCLNYFDGYAAVQARRRYGLNFRIVFHAVGIPTARYFRAVPIDRMMMKTVLAEADAVLGLSQFACDCIEGDFGVKPKLLPPPVVVGELQPDSRFEDPTILFVGDVTEPRKGAETLILAMPKIRERIPNARLLLSGHVTEDVINRLMNKEAVRELEPHIQFLGVGNIGDLPALYRAASVCVLPSVWEAFGLVLVESLANGTPVVGSRHAGVTDIIEGNETVGRLFDPGSFDRMTTNVDGLADAVVDVLTAGDAMRGKVCHARAQHFSWDHLGPRYTELYQQLLEAS
ncbi:MAG: glycosyltransferase family 4 protein [Pseudomonadota bacterium]